MQKKKKIANYIVDLGNELGKGEFGSVVLGKNTETGEQVAVKVMDKKKGIYQSYEVGKDQNSKIAILREIEIMKNLKNQNIIQFYQVQQTTNNIYIVEELVKDGTLGDIIQKEKDGMSEEKVIDFIKQLVNGFSDLVKHGTIHRDFKPDNILVNNGILKIADFGFSRMADGKMHTEVGTPVYMAPQILNLSEYKSYTYKCDIWSFGVVCYQLAFGRRPWNENKNSWIQLYDGIKMMLTKNGLVFPSTKQVSKQLKQFIIGCLQFEEKNRFDWNDIFKHPIFKDYFNKKDISNEDSTIAASLIRMRLYVHSENINIIEILKGVSNEFSVGEFYKIIRQKQIDPEINQFEAECIFNKIGKGKKTITRDEFAKFLSSNSIKVTGLKKK